MQLGWQRGSTAFVPVFRDECRFFITEQYLCQILSGKRGCSQLLARNIANCISFSANLEDYFYKKGE